MKISDVKGGESVRMLEDLEQSKLKMVILFVGNAGAKTTGCMLVFDGVQVYQIFEKRGIGAPTVLSLSVVEKTKHGSHIRIDTSRGYREIHCRSARVCNPKMEV